MSKHICKLLTDRGSSYPVFQTSVDLFLWGPFATINQALTVTGDGFETGRREAREHVYDMRTGALKKADRCVGELQRGKRLLAAEMDAVRNLLDFVEATIGPDRHPAVDRKLIGEWIEGLGLRTLFPGRPDDALLIDYAVFPAIQEVNARRRDRHFVKTAGLRKKTRAAQNKLAGRYVAHLAQIANVFGPDAARPEEIVKQFCAYWQKNGDF